MRCYALPEQALTLHKSMLAQTFFFIFPQKIFEKLEDSVSSLNDGTYFALISLV